MVFGLFEYLCNFISGRPSLSSATAISSTDIIGVASPISTSSTLISSATLLFLTASTTATLLSSPSSNLAILV